MVNAERLTLFIVEQVPVDTSRRNKKNKGKGHKVGRLRATHLTCVTPTQMAMSKTAGDLQEFKASIQQMDLHSLPQAPGLDRQDSETRSQGASPVLATRKRKPGMPRAPSFSTPRSLAGGAAPFSAIDMDLGKVCSVGEALVVAELWRAGEFVDQLGGVYKRELVCRISKDAVSVTDRVDATVSLTFPFAFEGFCWKSSAVGQWHRRTRGADLQVVEHPRCTGRSAL